MFELTDEEKLAEARADYELRRRSPGWDPERSPVVWCRYWSKRLRSLRHEVYLEGISKPLCDVD
jgi:hypothetical protein